MPTTSLGRDGFSDFSLSEVFSWRPAISSSYSLPNCPRTSLSARSIASRFVDFEKSVTGSFRNACGCTFTGSVIVLLMNYLSLQIGRGAFHDLPAALEHVGGFI